MNKQISIQKDKIARFCKKHHIQRLAIFGSSLRNDFGPESDIDILVDFEPGRTPGFFKLFEMEDELSTLFGVRKVDLRTPQDLSQYFREKVIKDAEVQYIWSS
ncbi:MAG: nucleotidyltransferase family protein [Candidatus Aminicenantes bacterium]|nr:MAG: nucleotidyltransferase family protein [Candidatus Aminicenantes bacterium]